jgi:molecular chaperone GrpE|tara:strand:+ start:5089 stop:5676 length:588 start_codon:yes stop_codon:yes gene_type:complete
MDENNKKSQKNIKQINDEVKASASNEKLKKKTIEEKLQEAEEKQLRSLAEIENQRRRFEKDIKDAFEFGSFNFAKESLAILDNLQRAKLAIKNDDGFKNNKDLDKFLDNLTIIEKDLVSIFEKNKITKIETKDKKFDPNFHQAMSEIENNVVETGTILQEIQAGYMLGERLLRPALVGIAKNNEENEEKKEKISL